MKRHARKIWIPMVLVSSPAGRIQVNFHVPSHWQFTAELQNRPAKVRAGFAIPKARMQNPNFSAVQGAEVVALDALVKPDGLQEFFGRPFARRLAQTFWLALNTPAGVKTSQCRAHVFQ
jgi:hypothetical protein